MSTLKEELKNLKDEEVLARTELNVAEERRITAENLLLFHENYRRRLFAKLGYQSLFDFLVRHLKYSESAAFRRTSAVKLMSDVPVIETQLKEGTINLSTVVSL